MSMQRYAQAVSGCELVRRIGRVTRFYGLVLEASGPDAFLGEVCEVHSRSHAAPVLAEVVGLRDGTVLLMPYGELRGIGLGSEVIARGQSLRVPAGEALLGRVVDAFCKPLDDRIGGAQRCTARTVDHFRGIQIMSFHYRYPLQSLKTMRGRELETAQAALNLAQAEVDVAQRQLASAEEKMREVEALLRALQRDGNLDLDRYRRARDFLRRTRGQVQVLREELNALIEKRISCSEAVKLGKTGLRSLERHESRLSERAFVEYTRCDQRASDDAWLMVAMRRKREAEGRA